MWIKSPILMVFLRRVGVMGSLEKRRGLAITGACVHTFFGAYLKGAPVEEMSSLPDLYLELKIGNHHGVPTSGGDLLVNGGTSLSPQ